VRRHDDLAASETFRYQQHRRIPCRDRPLDLINQHMFGDAVDRIDRVSFFLPRDTGKRCRGRALTGVDDITTDSAMQGLNGGEKRVGWIHAGVER